MCDGAVDSATGLAQGTGYACPHPRHLEARGPLPTDRSRLFHPTKYPLADQIAHEKTQARLPSPACPRTPDNRGNTARLLLCKLLFSKAPRRRMRRIRSFAVAEPIRCAKTSAVSADVPDVAPPKDRGTFRALKRPLLACTDHSMICTRLCSSHTIIQILVFI